jgi:hypothetical protein
MQNITQTVLFPVSSIIATPIPDDLKELLIKIRQARMADPDGVSQGLISELRTKTPEKIQSEVSAYGAVGLESDVEVVMRLGTALFDVYMRMTPEPAAPLGKLIWRKKNMELAEIFDRPEFDLPSWAASSVTRALMDETIWNNLSLSVWVEVGPAAAGEEPLRKYFTVSAKGSSYFGKILEAAANLVYSEEMKDAR